MKRIIRTGFFLTAFLSLNAVAQDWYHDRDGRFQGEQWRSQVFSQVRNDLDHIYADRARDRERTRLDKTRSELSQLQADLDQGRFDNGILNDVIDSLAKSANDTRLAPRDREILSDDRSRLKDYQSNHNHWKR